MSLRQKRERIIINKFQSMLRSGFDYKVSAMYEEAGKLAFIQAETAKRTIRNYYKGLITQEMTVFVYRHNCNPQKLIELFSNEFNVCLRESRLLIRYIKRSK